MVGGGESSQGVQPDPFGYSRCWVIGMYRVGGFKTRLPTATQRAEALTPGIMEGVIVERLEGANWWGIVIGLRGIRYNIYLVVTREV